MLHLFRPFLKVDITTSSLDPRKICAECASKIAISVSKYRRTYGLRRVPIVMTHCIFASSIVHLINLPKPSDAHDLAQSLVALREMSSNHAFAIRYIGIVFALAKQWNIHLPDGVAQYNLPPVNAHSSQDYLGYPSPSSSNQSQPQDQILGSCIANELPFAAVRSSPRTFTQPAEMFWTPFKGQSVPLHAPEPQATGPMDISAMLAWDLNRDGFQVANFGDFLGPPLYQPNGHADSHAQLNGFMNGQAPGHVNGHWPPS